MRFLILAIVLTAAACAPEETAAPGLAAGTFTSGDRDALCIAGTAGAQRGGFIVYGDNDTNCSASGRIAQAAGGWMLAPAGDVDCRIPLSVTASGVSLGSAPPACAYYCGPGAAFAGKSFERSPGARPVADLAGDPLC